jgi:hypothetical protein
VCGHRVRSHGRRLRGDLEPLIPFHRFNNWELEGQGVWERSHAGVPKPKNTKGVCWFRTKKSVEKGAHAQIFSRPVPEDKGTYGFIQRFLARARRAILAQKKIDSTSNASSHQRRTRCSSLKSLHSNACSSFL